MIRIEPVRSCYTVQACKKIRGVRLDGASDSFSWFDHRLKGPRARDTPTKERLFRTGVNMSYWLSQRCRAELCGKRLCDSYHLNSVGKVHRVVERLGMTASVDRWRFFRGRWFGIAVLVGAAALGGCFEGADSLAVIVRDSAGVVVVESRGRAWVGDGAWRVAEEPLLEIGSAEGSPDFQFHRVEGALRLDDGRIVVADGGSSEIRVFDGSGQFRSKSGRQGDAPGEYRLISGLGCGPGDSLWVFDYGNRRFTVLSDDAEPIRTVSVGGTLSAVGAVGRLPDGSFVVKQGWGSPTDDKQRTGLTRDPIAVARYTADGSSVDTLGMFPGREVFVSVEDGRGVMSTPLFAHNTSAALLGDAVFVGDQQRMEVGLYSADGDLLKLFRVPDFDLRISASDIEDQKRQLLERQPPERRAEARNQLDGMDVPHARPAYGRLLVGSDGSLWAAEHVRYPTFPGIWTVFGYDGRLLGTVVMPDRFTVFQIGSDWVLGVGLDELDVEHVRLYRLEK